MIAWPDDLRIGVTVDVHLWLRRGVKPIVRLQGQLQILKRHPF